MASILNRRMLAILLTLAALFLFGTPATTASGASVSSRLSSHTAHTAQVMTPVKPQRYTSLRQANVGRPPTPRGGSIYGPFASLADCNRALRRISLQPGWQAACFLWDDGNWYIAVWPPQDNETWINVNSRLFVEVYHSSLSDGGTVDQYPYNGTNTQWWFRLDEGNGYYRLINKNSGLCMGVSGGSLNVGASVVQWDCNGNPDQTWHFSFTGQYQSGYPVYNFVNANSGFCLDVPHSSTSAGQALWQYPCNGTSAQMFY